MLNRRGFDERLRSALAHTRRHDTPLTLVSLDLDHFKAVNDEHGHGVGDGVLRCLGRVLLGCSRAEDVVARVGGEEFGVLLPGVEGVAGVRYAQRVQQALAEALEANRLPAVTLSAGVAVQRGSAPGTTSIDETADAALYRAKREGRDRVCFAPEPALALAS